MIKQRGGSKLYGAILVIAALVLFSTVSFRSPEETTFKAAAATPSKEEVHKTKQHNGSDVSPLDWTDRWEASLPLAGVIPKEPSVIGITVWLGGNLPDYVPQFLASVKRNPELYMMIPSVTDTELFCPGKKAGTRYDGNIKYVCMSSDDLYALMSSKMCKVWECDENESQKIKEEVKKWISGRNYAVTELKPAFGSIFEDHWDWEDRQTKFTHWLRLDLDMIIGDMRTFPWHLLTYDAIALRPFDQYTWKNIWWPGMSTALRIDPQLDRIWLRIPDMQTPTTFMEYYQKERKDGQKSVGYGANDEGSNALQVTLATEFTWVIWYGALQHVKWKDYHLDIRGGDKLRTVIYAPDRYTDREVLRLHKLPFRPDYTNVIQNHGPQRLSFRCEGNGMWWILQAARSCIEHREGRFDYGRAEVLSRDVPLGPINRRTVVNPYRVNLEVEMDSGKKGYIEHYRQPLLHLQNWKITMYFLDGGVSFRRKELQENEFIHDRGGGDNWNVTLFTDT